MEVDLGRNLHPEARRHHAVPTGEDHHPAGADGAANASNLPQTGGTLGGLGLLAVVPGCRGPPDLSTGVRPKAHLRMAGAAGRASCWLRGRSLEERGRPASWRVPGTTWSPLLQGQGFTQ